MVAEIKNIEDKKNLIIFYLKNKIERNKTELCGNFLIELSTLLMDSFLGPESFEDGFNGEDMKAYANWCFEKVCEKFKQVYNFDFSKKERLKLYCLNFSLSILTEYQKDNFLFSLHRLLKNRFNLFTDKEEDELKIFLSLYTYFYN